MPSRRLRRVLLVAAVILATCSTATAQTKGRFTIGPQVSWHFPVGNELDSSVSLGVAYSLSKPKTHDGWGPDFGFGWYGVDLADPLAGHLNVRPLLGGYGYTMVRGKVRTHFAVLTGPAFAKIKVTDADRVAWSALLGVPVNGVDVKNSWVVKPGARVTYSLRPRLGVFVSTDYELARLTLQIQTDTERRERKLKGDVVNVKLGFTVGVF